MQANICILFIASAFLIEARILHSSTLRTDRTGGTLGTGGTDGTDGTDGADGAGETREAKEMGESKEAGRARWADGNDGTERMDEPNSQETMDKRKSDRADRSNEFDEYLRKVDFNCLAECYRVGIFVLMKEALRDCGMKDGLSEIERRKCFTKFKNPEKLHQGCSRKCTTV